MEKIVLNVLGMSCSHCEKAVTEGLTELSGVMYVQVDLQENTVTVEYDVTKISIDTIKTEIVEIGYEVS
jgi:copper chaperone